MSYEQTIKLQAKIDTLQYLLDRECNCDKSKCAEHFSHIRSLKYDYEQQLKEIENEESAIS